MNKKRVPTITKNTHCIKGYITEENRLPLETIKEEYEEGTGKGKGKKPIISGEGGTNTDFCGI